jgi:hypothetical protein|tara:strand:+ start:961 stop:1152 length:192 start_codon:yes stop_codon:yes gene_type:complete
MDKQILQANQIASLRESGVLKEKEYAFLAGDLVIAEDVETSNKRVLGKASELLHEGKKRILLG